MEATPPPRRQRKALQPGQATAPETAEGEMVKWMTKGGRCWRGLSPGEDEGVGSQQITEDFPFSFVPPPPADWGEGDQDAPLGRHGSPWVVASDAGRGWDFFKKKHSYAATIVYTGCVSRDSK